MTPKSILIGLALAAGASLANAQVLASDDFSYVGPLTSNGWVAHSGSGNKVIMSDGDVATLEQSSGSGEDDSLLFTTQGATDTTWFSFTLNVPSGNPVNVDSDGLYFAHLKNSGTFFHARVTITAPASGGDFGLGISNSSSITGGVIWASDLSFDTNYQVVCSWDASTDTATMWIDPTSMGDTSISTVGPFPGDLMEAFALRQSSDYTGFITIDDVIVGKSFDDVAVGGGPFTSSCFGDGSGVPCGCGNESNPGDDAGCLNGLGVGAALSASGTPDTTADTMVLTADDITDQPGLFFQGDNLIGGGTGTSFGDGIRCCGMNVIRIQVVDPPATPNPTTASTSVTISAHPAQSGLAGSTRCYQYWYRNPGSSPCGSNFNLSNAVTATWM